MAGGSARSTRSTRKSTRNKRKHDNHVNTACEEGGDNSADDTTDGGEKGIKSTTNELKAEVSRAAAPLSENVLVLKRIRTAACRDCDVAIRNNLNDAPSKKTMSSGELNAPSEHAIDSSGLESSEVAHAVAMTEIRSVDVTPRARPSNGAQSQSQRGQSLEAETRLSITVREQNPFESSIETPGISNLIDESSIETSENKQSATVGSSSVKISQNQSEHGDESKRQDQHLDLASDVQLQSADDTERNTVCDAARELGVNDKPPDKTHLSNLSEAKPDHSKLEDANRIRGIDNDADSSLNDKVKSNKSEGDGETPIIHGNDLNVIGGAVELSSPVKPLNLRKLPTCSAKELQQKTDLESEPGIKCSIETNDQNDHSDLKYVHGVKFEFPQVAVKKQAPSANQLKIALFLESAKVNHGAGNERALANYWESLERCITFGSHAGNISRSKEMMNSFLTTKRMKYLHNKLILTIMSDAMGTEFSARQISRHLPLKWKDKTVQRASSTRIDIKEGDDNSNSLGSDMRQWHETLGKEYGAWTPYGKEITYSTSQGALSLNYHTSNKPRATETDENDTIPPARAPASLHFDPIVRRHLENEGMRISDDASWLLTLSVQKYLSSVLRKTIANGCQVSEGHATKVPKSSAVTLKCSLHKSSKDTVQCKNNQPSSDAAGERGRANSLGVAELASALISDPLIAGGVASSRLASMRANTSYGNDLARDNLNLSKAQNLINASIQQADLNNGNRGDRTEIGIENTAHEKVSQTAETLQTNNSSNTSIILLQPPQDNEVPAVQSLEKDNETEVPESERSSSTPPPSIGINSIFLMNDAPRFRPLAKAHFNVTSKPDHLSKNNDDPNPNDSMSLISFNNKDETLDLTSASGGPQNEATPTTAIRTKEQYANEKETKQLLHSPTNKDFNYS